MTSVNINQICRLIYIRPRIIVNYMKIFISIILLNSISIATAKVGRDELNRVKEVFPKAIKLKKVKVSDPISKSPINTTIFEIYSDVELLGFARGIETTTGCNSSCLPISYMSFYDEKGSYLKLSSEVGLTKIYHAPFTSADYAKLDLILALAPEKLSAVKNPLDMTDALSGETLKAYKDVVVKGAAYSSLRIHLYNQLSLKQIKLKSLKK